MARVFGLETEYAAIWQGDGEQPSQKTIFSALAESMATRFQVAAPTETSVFLPNGGRFYFDDEAHQASEGLIEWSTPECLTPSEATLYDLAGEHLLAAALPEAEKQLGGQLTLLKNNTSGNHTYGCHENYLVPRLTEYLPDENAFFHYLVRCLAPFLVTRSLLCSAGLVSPLRFSEPATTGFQISQRADFITGVLSEDARRYRPIINVRDEPHADRLKYRRLHLLVGDSNMSAWCTFMKLGTTHLILSVCEALALDVDFVLVNPIHALRSVSYHGRHAQIRIREKGREVARSALDIQRDYLNKVKDFFGDISSDSEEALIIAEWQEALDYLKYDPPAMGDRLDWVIKLLLLETERGVSRINWDNPTMALLDLRYHDIDPRRGLFPRLLDNGVVHYGALANRIAPAAVSRAIDMPPTSTRAYVRGNYVKWSWEHHFQSQADWSAIIINGQRISLDDPLDFCSGLAAFADAELSLAFLHTQLQQGPISSVRGRAAQAIASLSLDPDRRCRALASGLGDPDWKVRVQTVEALTSLRPTSIELLRQATLDPHIAVRRRVHAALS
ncbi:MAG: proteasome accessory factor PafA2 family protein [Anaerolineales bacterium]|nr:proteasome accessory factor PafA2 family protein [Anaerolineales bacterium]